MIDNLSKSTLKILRVKFIWYDLMLSKLKLYCIDFSIHKKSMTYFQYRNETIKAYSPKLSDRLSSITWEW